LAETASSDDPETFVEPAGTINFGVRRPQQMQNRSSPRCRRQESLSLWPAWRTSSVPVKPKRFARAAGGPRAVTAYLEGAGHKS